MKKLIIFTLISIFSWQVLQAQTENPDNKKLTKEEKKAIKKAKKEETKRKQEEALILYNEIAKNRTWVVEAHTVYDKSGASIQMDPTINFVGVNEEEVVIQLSFNNLIGWNGVGGITLEGKPGKYEVKADDKAVTIQMTAMGSSMGRVDIMLTVTGDGNGRALVNGNFGDRLTFSGYFVPLSQSRVFKGTTTY